MIHIIAYTGGDRLKAHLNTSVAVIKNKVQFINSITVTHEGRGCFVATIAVRNPARIPDRVIKPLKNVGSISMSVGTFPPNITRNG